MQEGPKAQRRLFRPLKWATICAGALVFLVRPRLKRAKSSAEQERHIRDLSHYIAEQERIREQFAQVEKLSALGELASGVAHDFNNTLAGILGRAQLLLRTNDPEKIQRGLKIIIKTAEDGAKTVRRIQDFARQRRDKDFTLLSVDQILRDVSEITRPRWKNKAEAENIHINLDLQLNSTAKIMGDESELREVLINMVFNAIDAMPQGGRITLAAEDSVSSVILSVTDNGTGMSPECRSRLFDPFFTTKGAGLGLGLAVSFGTIRRHEGTIEVDSELGKGTTFRVVLPIANEAEEPVSVLAGNEGAFVNEVARAETTDEQARILVVDDEEYVRDLLREILEGVGCRVYLAQDGHEAMALFEARRFDAIFTDVGMPGMSGWELARAVRQCNEVVPIALITGWGDSVGSREQEKAKVDWVVTKPFRTERIAELVLEIKNRRNQRAVSLPIEKPKVA